MNEVILRAVDDADSDAIFEMMRDPEAVRMAAFTADHPDDRAAFDAHLARVRSAPDNLMFAVEVDGSLVGTTASFTVEGDREVTYWIDRSRWGEGIAGEALRQLLERDPTRPIMARAASANVASIAVLRRNGFVERGREISFAAGAGGMIEETLFTLDAPSPAETVGRISPGGRAIAVADRSARGRGLPWTSSSRRSTSAR